MFGIEKSEFIKAEGLDIDGNDADEIMKKAFDECRRQSAENERS